MPNTTNHKARKLGKRDLQRVFRLCGFKDGLGEEPANQGEFTYWSNKARDGLIGDYITFEPIASEPLTHADNGAFGRIYEAQLDIFSTASFDSKRFTDALEKLESQLLANGFEIEAWGEDYEPETRLYHQIFIVRKAYF